MTDWLSLIGIGEDGAPGLCAAAQTALARADVVFGGTRHLAMIEHGDKRPWPVPFSPESLLALRGRARVAALVSGDPFWHGAGGTLAKDLRPEEWRCYPQPSVFSLAAARLGWRLEEVTCLGLHAAPLTRLKRDLQPGQRLIVTLRDGKAPAELAAYLATHGFGTADLWVMERLGGPDERITRLLAGDAVAPTAAPVACAIELRDGPAIPLASGRDDVLFEHDGQITKRPIRALALSALAPRAGELLWDLGSGSGSVAVEWLLAHPKNRAIGVERDPVRAARALSNIAAFCPGAGDVLVGENLAHIAALPDPDAVFVGGGFDHALLDALWARLPVGCRLVVHGVTLETESMLAKAHGRFGGSLLRIELSEAAPLGRLRGWKASYPVVQWQVVR
ncbi:precorrin-6y C5,15-methyltransferase (decarboxylating) subunit CbiE [Falsigemmobacter faecalis]|uniref:Precorrin-6y C5,15-methyltransferase (Decarboxylating) subunit CbiE n=1 Tax=Falsigemmobacter faecalis TaxID=2488730 RepID=A0A3P3DCT4_9RHOB|nr:precorrin-6y C5,15-methyltransferase (decarboxylating) subunit CbiE [Falsigemmobacter faecalis]RRH72061.1 precorrin-6y C5,15-methyltransferase (decarboxylating) subunit CbiE [Falsigemmobacter faecalis]